MKKRLTLNPQMASLLFAAFNSKGVVGGVARAVCESRNIAVTGNLRLSPKIRELPEGTWFLGDLNAAGSGLVHLPDVDVLGNATFAGSEHLRSIDSHARFARNANFDRAGICAFNNEVGGDLDLSGCPAIFEIGERTRVGGFMSANSLPKLEGLAATVKGSALLTDCPNLRSIDPKAVFVRSLALFNIGAEAIDCRIGGDLQVKKCSNLSSLNAETGGGAHISDCPNLASVGGKVGYLRAMANGDGSYSMMTEPRAGGGEHIPHPDYPASSPAPFAGERFHGDLVVANCPNVATIVPGTCVDGSLTANGTRISALENVNISANGCFRGCEKLASIDARTRIGESLLLTGTKVESVPPGVCSNVRIYQGEEDSLSGHDETPLAAGVEVGAGPKPGTSAYVAMGLAYMASKGGVATKEGLLPAEPPVSSEPGSDRPLAR